MGKKVLQKDVKDLYRDLRNRSKEKDVEGAWRAIFKNYFVDKNQENQSVITSPFGVDGFIVENKIVFALRILLEFKDGTDLQKTYDRARVTIQCIYYMKLFQENGYELPNVIVGADENQAFVLYAPNFYKYLNRKDIDWTIAPSNAYKDKSNIQFMNELQNDKNLSVFVYDLESGKKDIKSRTATIQSLFDEVDSISNFDPATGDIFKVDVTESNLAVLFDDFVRITFGSLSKSDKLSPVDLVNIFQQLLLDRNKDKYYQLPADPNKLHLPGDKIVTINGADMLAFFKHFNRNLSIQEQDKLISISDRLIEDITRRRKGDYWTPTIWANKAVELLDDTLNNKWNTKAQGLIKDWKKDCIVWDCSSGSKNLTRDYRFEHLYSSTIHQAELDLASYYNAYPKTNVSFQYDFLNDDIEALSMLDNVNIHDLKQEDIDAIGKKLKMPMQLFSDLVANKPLVFYINPPFGTANTRSFSTDAKKKANKRNMAANKVRDIMDQEQMGKARMQLYAQFFFRIVKLINQFHLDNVILASFSPYQFRTGGDYFGTFYKYFLKTLHPFKGFLFSAGEFSNVNKDWGVSFGLYSNEKVFPLSENVEVSAFDKGLIKSAFVKTIRTVDKENSISNWLKLYLSKQTLGKPLPKGSYTEVTSAIKPVKSSKSGNYYENSLGYMYFIGNDVEHSDTAVSIFSTYFKSGHGVNIVPENLIPSIIGFSLRRSATFMWFNGKDAFCLNKEQREKLIRDEKFISNCLLFSLTQYRSSYQSSLGVNSINSEQSEVENKWFFLPLDIMKELYGNAKVSENMRSSFADEYNRICASEDTPIVKLLMKLGAKFSLQDTINGKKQVTVSYTEDNQFTSESKLMLQTLVDLFNSTWDARELAFSAHPEWSVERYDAGFNQLYRITKDIANNDQWLEDYDRAYLKLRDSIHQTGIELGIIPKDA